MNENTTSVTKSIQYCKHVPAGLAPSLILLYLEEIQDSHFPRKREYFGTHLHEFGEKGVNFDVQCFTVKKGVHLG